eukprot:1157674-Pelagomonas_calceolata.AAC.3
MILRSLEVRVEESKQLNTVDSQQRSSKGGKNGPLGQSELQPSGQDRPPEALAASLQPSQDRFPGALAAELDCFFVCCSQAARTGPLKHWLLSSIVSLSVAAKQPGQPSNQDLFPEALAAQLDYFLACCSQAARTSPLKHWLLSLIIALSVAAKQPGQAP